MNISILPPRGGWDVGYIKTREGRCGEYYSVLYGAAEVGTVGMIVEHSFHTNTRATKWLINPANLKAMAQAEAKQIAAWFGIDKPVQEQTSWYRVRKSWADDKSQLGAFANLEYAIAACKEGYAVYDPEGVQVYPETEKQPQDGTVAVELPVLRRGDKSDAVRAMQALLIGWGYSCGSTGVDGSFGPATENALEAFREDKDLPEGTICDLAVWESLLGVMI